MYKVLTDARIGIYSDAKSSEHGAAARWDQNVDISKWMTPLNNRADPMDDSMVWKLKTQIVFFWEMPWRNSTTAALEFASEKKAVEEFSCGYDL